MEKIKKTTRIAEETKGCKKYTRIDEYENGDSTTSTILMDKDEIKITGPNDLRKLIKDSNKERGEE